VPFEFPGTLRVSATEHRHWTKPSGQATTGFSARGIARVTSTIVEFASRSSTTPDENP